MQIVEDLKRCCTCEETETHYRKSKRSMKSDVYIFGVLLLKLIAKNEFICRGPYQLDWIVIDEAKHGERYLVHECFEEVDYSNAFEITLLAFLCLNLDHPDKRPTMKDVVYALKLMQERMKKRKRDEMRQNRISTSLLAAFTCMN
ncbi:probable LRR receptor-like serine/threonine-protein kinase At1g51860 [Solanum stenotomum]|uniref:probable LRR receptor-like serine/threonine-protein kinase At1g51860 n=1 Tax=Solanum stenotomum TaxID=172797 RepID=UPI0020D05602|nr:probable LRR receptor-like serine/threonine-protein kinase At1g51860 [Solanum stenotomum]